MVDIELCIKNRATTIIISTTAFFIEYRHLEFQSCEATWTTPRIAYDLKSRNPLLVNGWIGCLSFTPNLTATLAI